MQFSMIALLKSQFLISASEKSKLLSFVSLKLHLANLIDSNIAPEKSQFLKEQDIKFVNFMFMFVNLHEINILFSKLLPTISFSVKVFFLQIISRQVYQRINIARNMRANIIR